MSESSLLMPGNVPQMPEPKVRDLLKASVLADDRVDGERLLATCPAMVLAIRGYYSDTFGARQRNDVGFFDDAAFLVTPDRLTRWNWNTDPSKVGWNASIGKPYAMLQPGVWPFIKGQHKGKGPAWRQPDEDQAAALKLGDLWSSPTKRGHFLVWRAKKLLDIVKGGALSEWGYQAINIHWGGSYGTSSWACQTAPPAQWPSFQRQSYAAVLKPQLFLPYVLINNPDIY